MRDRKDALPPSKRVPKGLKSVVAKHLSLFENVQNSQTIVIKYFNLSIVLVKILNELNTNYSLLFFIFTNKIIYHW